MELIQRLVLFADIVEKGSIAAAARSREMTRSAISKQLAKLEQETGVRLLNRNTRSMSLTGPGHMLYEQALRVREKHLETEALIAGISQEVSGELRVTSSFHIGRFVLLEAIRTYSTKYPRVVPNLQLTDRTSDIISDKIDLAVRIGNLQDSRLVGRRLCDNPVVMAASPGFLAGRGEPKTMGELANTPCLIYQSEEVTVDNWVYFEAGREKSVGVQAAFKTSDGQLLLDACLAGYGVALLPTYAAAAEIHGGALKVVLPDVRLKDYQAVYLVYASRRHLSPALSELIAHLRLWVQQHPIAKRSELVDGGCRRSG